LFVPLTEDGGKNSAMSHFRPLRHRASDGRSASGSGKISIAQGHPFNALLTLMRDTASASAISAGAVASPLLCMGPARFIGGGLPRDRRLGNGVVRSSTSRRSRGSAPAICRLRKRGGRDCSDCNGIGSI
jgi:hypothetical protein